MPQELILTFHGLGEPADAVAETERKVWVPVEWLQAIVDMLPRQGVGLAFDDGNSSDVEQALPMLAQRGLTARFFPLAGRVGAVGYLGAEDIAGLSGAGMGVGSHGCHHRDWRTLADGELHEELTVSRRTLAEIVGRDITETACPYGSYDRRVLRALRAAGYRRVFNSDGGTGSAGSWLRPRTTVHRDRPLEHWLNLVTVGPSGRPDPVLLGKRLIKRLR
jgi:peptidoglycan/xylan/chitin deacetylase (PgdA/CDA1 family)